MLIQNLRSSAQSADCCPQTAQMFCTHSPLKTYLYWIKSMAVRYDTGRQQEAQTVLWQCEHETEQEIRQRDFLC